MSHDREPPEARAVQAALTAVQLHLAARLAGDLVPPPVSVVRLDAEAGHLAPGQVATLEYDGVGQVVSGETGMFEVVGVVVRRVAGP